MSYFKKKAKEFSEGAKINVLIIGKCFQLSTSLHLCVLYKIPEILSTVMYIYQLCVHKYISYDQPPM